MLVDFALMCGSFFVSYALLTDGLGGTGQRSIFLQALPIVLTLRYVAFVGVGIYRRVWRFAGPQRPARDRRSLGRARASSRSA